MLPIYFHELESFRRVADDRWRARCPAHAGHSDDSLSIVLTTDGTILIRCFGGCSCCDVCDALGIKVADLFRGQSPRAESCRRPKKSQTRLRKKRSVQTFSSPDGAIASLMRGKSPDRKWSYSDPRGRVIGWVCRWDTPQGKEIRPVSRHNDGWAVGGMPNPRPLYALADVLGAYTVYICEGEPAADALRSIGLTATCCAHGAGSVNKTDWTPLRDIRVVIVPDNDNPGRKYAANLLAILPHAIVIDLADDWPGLPEKGDAVEWLANYDGLTAEELRARIETLVQRAGGAA